MGLQVKLGKIIIRAPFYITKKQIDAVVTAKSSWLKAKVQEQISQPSQNEVYLKDGSTILFFGEPKELTLSLDKIKRVELEGDLIAISLLPRHQAILTNKADLSSYLKKNLVDWFKEELTTYIEERTLFYCEKMKVEPRKIIIKKYKARWGSCNNKQEVSFNSLLTMAPHWVIDYVIVHELAHIVYLNHSKQFWALVSQHYPDIKQAKDWLKVHQQQLSW